MDQKELDREKSLWRKQEREWLEEQADFEKQKRVFEEIHQEYQTVQRTEQELLEIIADYSRGTTAQRAALLDLEANQEEHSQIQRQLSEMKEGYQQWEKNLRETEDSLAEKAHALRKEEVQ